MLSINILFLYPGIFDDICCKSSNNRLWDVVDNTCWVIRSLVDIEWDVIRLVIWHLFTTVEVEGVIMEVYNLLLASIVILRPCLPKVLHRFKCLKPTKNATAPGGSMKIRSPSLMAMHEFK